MKAPTPVAMLIIQGKRWFNEMLASIKDAFSQRSHSRDFEYARGDYLRNRVLLLAGLFLILLPFWSLLDRVMLPRNVHHWVLYSRGIMVLSLMFSFILAYKGRVRIQRARLAAGLLLAIPAVFYAALLAASGAGSPPLLGYSFIPYMLVAMLAIFPFTLIESLVLGMAFIALEAYALFLYGQLMTVAGVQALWLLAALLSIAIAANYFQLNLMLRLYREATHDPLTGLLNRGALVRASHQLIDTRPQGSVAVLMMDLDHFKRINDQYGHMVGDEVLRNFSMVLRQAVRPIDILGRYGGEEFTAVLVGADHATAMTIAEKIRAQTQAQNVLDFEGRPVLYTVSIGVTMLGDTERFEHAVQRADHGLYEAKKRSRNCVVAV